MRDFFSEVVNRLPALSAKQLVELAREVERVGQKTREPTGGDK